MAPSVSSARYSCEKLIDWVGGESANAWRWRAAVVVGGVASILVAAVAVAAWE
jgi:hypothetical protein